nr:CYTH domain-containing protein [Oscillospiraceae bacterium]
MGREFELKYRADASQLAAIREAFGAFRSISMETTYYDTPDHALGDLHWTLRRRMENGRSVCTVKTPEKNGARGEWEAECDSIEDAVPLLCRLGAPEILPRIIEYGLVPACGARFTRLAKEIPLDGCRVELALDQGALMGGKRELAFAEVEVELKSGSEQAAAAFAKALAVRFGLVPEPKSKVQRALELAVM